MEELRWFFRALGRVMRRRMRHAWRNRQLWNLLLNVASVFFMASLARWWLPARARAILLQTTLALLSVWAGVRISRLSAKALRYLQQQRSREAERFVLVYEATLEPYSETLCQLASQALQEAEAYLQTTLTGTMRSVHITTRELESTLRGNRIEYSGTAHREAESIFVVYNPDTDALYRTLLHEWAHVITARWHEDEPALFLEGIAVATAHHTEPIRAHAAALYFLHYFPSRPLAFLLDRTGFYDPQWQYAHYAWAGSFTLYLIERFGMARFREFYTHCRQREEDRAFQQVFGMSMGQAEMLWREYLHAQLPESMRTEQLQKALEDRLRWATIDGEGILVVQALSVQMVQARPDHWLGYYGQAYCAFWKGDLHGALHAFEQANAAPIQNDDALRGRAWFECGLLCDLLQRRERAIKCYQTALQYPDHEDARAAYHARATRYLATPYDYAERYRFLTEVQQVN